MNDRLKVAAIGIGLAVFVMGCARLDFGDIVSSDVPREVQAALGLPPTLPLNDSREEYERFAGDVQEWLVDWKASIADSEVIESALSGFTMNALGTLEGVAGSVAPWAAGPLAGLIWYIGARRKRGQDWSPEQQEAFKIEMQKKIDAIWDEAFSKGIESIKVGASITKPA